MPMYDFTCDECAKSLERLVAVGVESLGECRNVFGGDCDGRLRKQLSAPAFHLKGSGFHANDYRKDTAARREDA